MKSFNRYFKANQNPTDPIEQPSSSPVNFFSRISYDSRSSSKAKKNDILHIVQLVLDHLQFHVIDVEIRVLDIDIKRKTSNLIELHHVQRTINSITNKKLRISLMFSSQNLNWLLKNYLLKALIQILNFCLRKQF